MSGERDDEPLELEPENAESDAFDDPEALERLRANAFESVGAPLAEGILYGMGVAEGLYDALRIARRFAGPLGGVPGHAGPGLGLLIRPSGLDREHCFSGSLLASVEAGVHQRRYGAAPAPICYVSAGYCSGWYSALFDEPVLVRELTCAAAQSAHCRFEARPVAHWTRDHDPWAEKLLKYLDFEAMREGAEKRLAAEGEVFEGDMMGAFDALSPAVHVWGPVMVLPYSGAGDSIAALETIAADLGERAIRVVVLDVTGARVDAVEALGLVRTLDDLARRQVETVIVGVSEEAVIRWLSGPQQLAHPLRAEDISEGIRLAFQLATFT
ncbi:MAG TPA: V4R domain-containing protein [Myxococcota bacterium]|nr:V4R domain-containing protein [Myxococcota bacterium]